MERPRETFRITAAFVRVRYREAACAAGIKNREFQDWAQSMAGMGVALAWDKEGEFDPERGPRVNFAIAKAKEVVRASLRDHHRYSKATEALSKVLTEPKRDKSSPYLSHEEARLVLNLLSPDQQRVIQLNHSGYDTEEITDIMKRKNNTAIYSLLRRARQKSREVYRELTSLGFIFARPKIGRSPPDDPEEPGPMEIRS